MPYSEETLRPWTLAQIQAHCGVVRTVVDVGAGAGMLLDFFRPHLPDSRWTAVEVWEPYITGEFDLRARYDEVIVADVRTLDPLPTADLYFCGDVLEHMTADDALALWERVRAACRWAVIALPVRRFEQGEVYGNKYEAHLVHWDTPGVLTAFAGIVSHSDCRPDLPPYYSDSVSGAFLAEGLRSEPVVGVPGGVDDTYSDDDEVYP